MDTNSQQWADLMSKLTALQALCAPGSGATQGEIEAATGRMQALLTRHSLTLDMVEPHLAPKDRDKLGVFTIFTTSATWRSGLLSAIAKNNFGRSIYMGNGSCEVLSDRNGQRIITDLYVFLSEVIEKLAVIEWDKFTRSDGFSHRYVKRTWLTSFRAGAVSGVAEAMKKARRDAVETVDAETAGTGSALVLVKDERLDTKYHELHPRTSQRKSGRVYTGAYASGQKAGAGISLGGQLGKGSTKAIG